MVQIAPTLSGCVMAHSSERIPPSEGPTAMRYLFISNFSVKALSAATMSRIVNDGKREPHRFPSGAIDDGPVEP